MSKRQHDRRSDLSNTFLRGIRSGGTREEKIDKKKRDNRKLSEAARSQIRLQENRAEILNYSTAELSQKGGESFPYFSQIVSPDDALSKVEEEKLRRTREERLGKNNTFGNN